MAARPRQLYFTDDVEARRLLASDPMALVIGFALDQQVPVQKAFAGPLAIKQRVGTLDADVLANTDLEPVFREKPAIHRFPGNMARRVSAIAKVVAEDYDGDAAQIWKTAKTPEELIERIEALPGFGTMTARSLASALGHRFGIKKALPLLPDHPMLGQVGSLEELDEYQAAKKIHRKEWYASYKK